MKRRLRIAVSVFFALVAIALCVLWVRSYWHAGEGWVRLTAQQFIVFDFRAGHLAMWSKEIDSKIPTPFYDWDSHPIDFPSKLRIWGRFTASYNDIEFPFWWLIVVSGMGSVSPLFRRFSLRTMLIATTFVAIVLGLAVWMSA
jgi:hypothetical protein